jgi:hypothetical protein
MQKIWTLATWINFRENRRDNRELTIQTLATWINVGENRRDNQGWTLDCQFLIAPSVFSNVYSCCQCLWIVNSWLPFQFSLTFIHVSSVSGLSILDCPSVFSNVYSCCQCLWIVNSWLPLRFSLTFIHAASVWIVYKPDTRSMNKR